MTLTAFHFPFLIAKRCPDAYCDENNILRGAKTQGVSQKYEGSYKDASKKEQNQRRWFGVDNRYFKTSKVKYKHKYLDRAMIFFQKL